MVKCAGAIDSWHTSVRSQWPASSRCCACFRPWAHVQHSQQRRQPVEPAQPAPGRAATHQAEQQRSSSSTAATTQQASLPSSARLPCPAIQRRSSQQQPAARRAMLFSAALQVVFKTSGGRIWNKRWGLPRLSRTRKENRATDIKFFNRNMEVLKAAAALQPEAPVRLVRPLPDWQRERMQGRLLHAQRLINLRDGGLLSRSRAAALMQRRSPPRPPLAGPPQDPQQQQHHLQWRVTAHMQRLRQQQAATQQQAQQQGPGKQQQPPPPPAPAQQRAQGPKQQESRG